MHGINRLSGRLQGGPEEGLEMRLLGLLGDDADFGLMEADFLDPVAEVVLLEAQPAVGVELAGLLEPVGPKVQDQQAPARFEDAIGLGERFPGVLSVVQGLAQEHQIDATVLEGDFFDVAQYIVYVPKFFFISEFPSKFYHFGGIIDAMDEFGLAGE
jgi:hypothetical protein